MAKDMEIVQVVGIGIIATITILAIKTQRPEIALQLGLISGLVIFFMLLGRITSIVAMLNDFAVKSKIDMQYIGLLFKIVGIAYICEFGSEICRDAGENSIASKIELAGKVSIMAMALPVVTALVNFLGGILS